MTGSLTQVINLFGRADFESRYGYSKEDMTQEQLEEFIHLLNTEINEDEYLMNRAWEIFDRVAASVGLVPKEEQ